MVEEGDDPLKALSLAEAFLLRFPNSDFQVDAYLAEMRALYRLEGIDQAVEAARRALSVDRDNLDALAFLSDVFRFSFKRNDREPRANLARANRDAQHGLEVLANLPKPDNLTAEQFNASVTPYRAAFNIAVGFVALQRRRIYLSQAGSGTGLEDAIEQAARSVNPPEGFTDYSHNHSAAPRTRTARAAIALASVDPYQQPWLLPPAVRGSSLIDPGESACLLNLSPHTSFSCRENARSASLGVVPDNSSGLASSESDTPEQEQASAPPPPPEPATQFDEQINNMTAEIDRIRREQAIRDAHPGLSPKPGPQLPAAVLIYQDGHQLEVRNYAVLGKTLWVFSDQSSGRIPLADLDLPATRKFNQSRGIKFEILDQE
jgi:hypothetical protein